MTEPSQDDITQIVSSIFDIRETVVFAETFRYKIDSYDFKDKFVKLAQNLELLGMAARLEKS